jgi:PII-like signaling protein
MQQSVPARLLRVHISESDRLGHRPLYEVIVARCREMKIAGATVFRGLEGYGETGEMHRARLVRHDQPILISIVDTADNIDRIIPVIEKMMNTGIMAQSDVKMIRVQKQVAAPGGTSA